MGLEQKIKKLVQEGEKALRSRKFDEVNAVLETLVGMRVDSPDIDAFMGELAMDQRNYDAALEIFLIAQAKNASKGVIDPKLEGNIGLAYACLDNRPTAIEHLENAIKLGNTDPKVQYYLGSSYRELNMLDEAAVHLLKAAQKGYGGELVYNEAATLVERFDMETALEYYLKAYKRGFRGTTILQGIADAYAMLNDYGHAIEYYKKGHRYASKTLPPLLGMAYCYLDLKKIEQAEQWGLKALKLQPEDGDVLCLMARIAIDRGILPIAESYLTKAVQLEPENANVHFTFTRFFMAKQEYDQALASEIHGLHILDADSNRTYYNNKAVAEKLRNIFFSINDKGKIVQTLSALLDNEQYRPHIGMVLSAFLHQDKTVQSRTYVHDLVDLLIKDPEFDEQNLDDVYLTPFGVSSNPVFLNTRDNFLNQSFVIKSHPKSEGTNDLRKALEEEYATLRFIHNVLSSEKIPPDFVPEPVLLQEHKEKLYLITNRYNLANLNEVLFADNEQRQQQICLALNSLAVVHGAITDELQTDSQGYFFTVAEGLRRMQVRVPMVSSVDEVYQRLALGKSHDKFQRLGLNQNAKSFFDMYAATAKETGVLFFLHNDFYTTNILVGGRLVDFERKAMGHPAIDLSMLLEGPVMNGMSPEPFVEFYLKQLSEFYADPFMHHLIRTHYGKMALHTSLMKIGTHLAQGQPDIARHYLQKSLQRMDGKLKDAFVAYVREANKPEFQGVL